MIDHATLVRWKALADKSLDEGSPEPERVASMRALAKEVAKIDLQTETVVEEEPEVQWVQYSYPRRPPPPANAHAFDPQRCGACNHDADSHTSHVRNGTCFQCTLTGKVCTRTRNEILGVSPENGPQFGRATRARR